MCILVTSVVENFTACYKQKSRTCVNHDYHMHRFLLEDSLVNSWHQNYHKPHHRWGKSYPH